MRFDTVLVANRGEIARRVIRACRAAGLRSVAVFSDADADALHVREADVAVRLGPTPAAESYLHVERVVAAALESGAGAIHPGYGFLSENAGFARAVRDAGLVLVGPTPEVMDLMGRKDRAREVAERAAVPVTPRYALPSEGGDAVPADAYPVLVKAAAGGGGKGMHVVREPGALAEALATAAREAASAFGDDTLLVERYVEGGRHVEVQVFGDEHGNVVHLLERDCSVQRRHQKVMEEAPAPGLDPRVRDVLHASSVALAREVGYTGAGTVEFLVRGDEAFFLEMNTRLQVEHPVTEEVTGLDLVRWQLDVAQGLPLPLRQDQVVGRGHAIEVRVYAEDPYTGFLPQAGRVERAAWSPTAGRVEAAIEGAADVTSSYDPMIAKIIGTGPDRDAAIADVLAAIDASAVEGIASNLGWLRRLVDSAEVRSNAVDTGWLDAYEGPLLERPDVPAEALALAAVHLLPRPDATPFGVADGWRPGEHAEVLVPVSESDGTTHRVVPRDPGSGSCRRSRGALAVTWQGQTWQLAAPDPMRRDAHALAGTADVVAPMPGTVLAVDVAVGDVVEAGQRLGAIEAMKMELTLSAPHAGTVTLVGAAAGDQVPMGHVVVHVEETADA